jgi:HKD family nuclease
MFYSQPLSTRFGTNLISLIQSGTWKSLDIAVAWVRASGIIHLEPALTAFLKAGNELRVTVGVDLDNTTKEGLASLLALGQHGAVSVFVHHNEANTIFHPKLYLFQNSARAKLIVGSNNITEAGLFQNTEAGLELELDIQDPVIVSVKNALDAWRDTTTRIAHQLDAAFLAELVTNGYVMDEASLKAISAARRKTSGTKTGAGKKLFGSVSVTPPQKPVSLQTPQTNAQPSGKKKAAASVAASAPSVTAPPATGQVLLMRVRTARGTQVQIPLAVSREPFFTGVSQVFSVAGGVTRGIHETHAKRAKGANPNTLKLEMPETHGMSDPVARFERTASGIQYEVYDASSAQGMAIMQALQAGRVSSPPTTTLTLRDNPSSATWWRFI